MELNRRDSLEVRVGHPSFASTYTLSYSRNSGAFMEELFAKEMSVLG